MRLVYECAWRMQHIITVNMVYGRILFKDHRRTPISGAVSRLTSCSLFTLFTRWVVEQTFGWLSRNRRLSKDYERKVQTSESLIQVAMIRLLLARVGCRG